MAGLTILATIIAEQNSNDLSRRTPKYSSLCIINYKRQFSLTIISQPQYLTSLCLAITNLDSSIDYNDLDTRLLRSHLFLNYTLIMLSSMDFLRNLIDVEMWNRIFTIEDLCDFLQGWAVSLHIDKVDEYEFNGIPKLF